jgi:DNA invertase Pin-like site-specific DNA recombinase
LQTGTSTTTLYPFKWYSVGAKAGLERARAQGKTLGRPMIDEKTKTAIRKALKKGEIGIRKIATTLCVGTGTVPHRFDPLKSRGTGSRGPARRFNPARNP